MDHNAAETDAGHDGVRRYLRNVVSALADKIIVANCWQGSGWLATGWTEPVEIDLPSDKTLSFGAWSSEATDWVGVVIEGYFLLHDADGALASGRVTFHFATAFVDALAVAEGREDDLATYAVYLRCGEALLENPSFRCTASPEMRRALHKLRPKNYGAGL